MFVAHVDEIDFAVARACRARGDARRAAADRQLRAGLRRRQRDDLQPRGDGHGRDREGRGARPKVVGKPSRAAVAELATHLGLPTSELAVIGDDLGMDIALGRIGGSRTVLVRSGISGEIELDRVPERRRPDAVVDGVADLLPLL